MDATIKEAIEKIANHVLEESVVLANKRINHELSSLNNEFLQDIAEEYRAQTSTPEVKRALERLTMQRIDNRDWHVWASRVKNICPDWEPPIEKT